MLRESMEDELPPKVVDRAAILFKMMGIPEDDFGIQHADFESAVFGGTNRLIANLDYDTDIWNFRIDEPLMNPDRIKTWRNIPYKYKQLRN